MVRGNHGKILSFIGKVRVMRGVQQVKYILVPILGKT